MDPSALIVLIIVALVVAVAFVVHQNRSAVGSIPVEQERPGGVYVSNIPSNPSTQHHENPSPTMPLLSYANARLQILSGPAQGRSIVVPSTTFLIERHPQSLLVNDPRVSRRHAVLEWHQGSWYVRDLNSRNGTLVNKVKVIPEQLVPIPSGTVLQFGQSSARFVSENTTGVAYGSRELLPSVTVLATVSRGHDSSRKLSERYEFHKQPIKGGFALVFEGIHRQTREKVGLKVLQNYTQVSSNIRVRFEREGALNLDHPHIVQTYDWGQTRDGPTGGEALYILMEWMGGKTLRHRMSDVYQANNLDQVMYIISGVCQALDYAHNRQIIHRDIKPENIMFTGTGVVKVVDFGVANVADGLRMTEIGTIIGTPHYMSPEQAAGDTVMPQSDIYAIGVVAFELLTGYRMFDGNAFAVIEHHIKTPPPVPSSVNSNLSKAVDQVLLRALDKQASRRFARATEFAQALSLALRK
ncbi:MAG: protein kinase domain-containing protein [Ardenticatenaceae bacterium]